jgi:hypothetical protein
MSKLLYGVSKKAFRYNGKSIEFGTPFEAADSHVRVLIAMTRASEMKPIGAMTSTAAIIPPAPKPTPTPTPAPPSPPVDATSDKGDSTGSQGDDAGEAESASNSDGNATTPPSESDTIVSLRERYKEKFGSSPDGRWSKARIVEELTRE